MIAKVSRGTIMDQIYIPKNRAAFPIGSYVLIKRAEPEEEVNLFYHNVKAIEPVKVDIIKSIFKTIDAENAIITGSFLGKGFRFNDLDIIIITDEKPDLSIMAKTLEKNTGITPHLIPITNKALLNGIRTDPLYRMMLSRYVSKKRMVYSMEKQINFRLLDLHLLKSETLPDNFDFLTGDQKYDMARNLAAIALFITKREVTEDTVDSFIKENIEEVEKIKNNTADKDKFIRMYKKLYSNTKNKILEGIKNEPKQE